MADPLNFKILRLASCARRVRHWRGSTQTDGSRDQSKQRTNWQIESIQKLTDRNNTQAKHETCRMCAAGQFAEITEEVFHTRITKAERPRKVSSAIVSFISGIQSFVIFQKALSHKSGFGKKTLGSQWVHFQLGMATCDCIAGLDISIPWLIYNPARCSLWRTIIGSVLFSVSCGCISRLSVESALNEGASEFRVQINQRHCRRRRTVSRLDSPYHCNAHTDWKESAFTALNPTIALTDWLNSLAQHWSVRIRSHCTVKFQILKSLTVKSEKLKRWLIQRVKVLNCLTGTK